MIRSFKSKQTELIWNGEFSKKFPPDMQQKARDKLRMLNNSQTIADLRIPPSNRLESLQGDRKGQYSIRINDQWRVCFSYQNGHVYDVEIVDYH
ncbi:MAG: type II toxin-antitoxin system RelE/ParE family toxin [Leptospirales bacterium]|nr:type II toxin-antitoxin system RelE/ParE family toxin [Leptospirales bacterium]